MEFSPSRRRLLLAALASPFGSARAQSPSRIQVFDLTHRPAAELAAIVQPVLADDEVVQASGFQLIVRARPETLAQVRELIERLDRAPRQLLISVRQPSEGLASRRNLGGEVEADRRGARGRVRIYGTESRERDGAAQRLRVLEGHAAFIQTGQAVPVGERNLVIGPGGAVVQDTTRYDDVTSGFYVLARIAGDLVILELSTRRDTLGRGGGGMINVRGATTTVRGHLGEWIEVGGSGERLNHEERGILYRSAERSEQRSRIELRVELVE